MRFIFGLKVRRSPGRIVIISEFVDPAQNSTGYYWSKVISEFASRAVEICVICPASSHDKLDGRPENVEYIYFEVSDFNKNNLAARIWGQMRLSLSFMRAIVSRVRADDRVFSGTNPALLLFFLSKLKFFLCFEWTLLVHDVFPENLVAARIVKRKGPLFHIVKYLFDRAYAQADTLIAIGRDMQTILREKTRNKSQVVYVPNWADPGDVKVYPRDVAGLLDGHDIRGKVVFQLFGNLGRLQGVDGLLEAINHVQSDRAVFVFIGSGAATGLIHDYIQRHPLRTVIHLGQMPFSRNNAGLSACDVAIVCLASGMNGLGVPSKAYFSMAADKPLLVVTDEGSELHMMVSENPSVGWFCPTGQPLALAELIDDICESDLSVRAGQPRAALLRKYAGAQAIDHYYQIVNRPAAVEQ